MSAADLHRAYEALPEYLRREPGVRALYMVAAAIAIEANLKAEAAADAVEA